MMHETPLVTTIVAGLGLAFLLGAFAHRLRVPPLVGYLLAGVAVGPYTPGFVADLELVPQLAEMGVILLMFGVGLHFSLKDLLSVGTIAIPGAIAQIAIATGLGAGLGLMLGWPLAGGLLFGLALSVASTVVLLRALQERRLVQTERGRIAVGWLVIEDLAMVLALVFLPAAAGLIGGDVSHLPDGASPETYGLDLGLAGILGITLLKVSAFIAVMLIVGRRVVPWLLHEIAHTGSRELFRLAVLSIALGVAFGAAELFDVSLALGAFFAGMVLSESQLSQRAAEESLPLRDAFAVLFFVSVGMLFDPASLLRDPLPVLATVLIICVGKSAAAFLIVVAFGRPVPTALTIAASLAQIGEFSFILAGLGLGLGILPEAGRDLILAGAILSIFLNPLAFLLIDRLEPRFATADDSADGTAPPPSQAAVEPIGPDPSIDLSGHVVLVGYGRVGGRVGRALADRGTPYAVIEDDDARVTALRTLGVPVVAANAVRPEALAAAGVARARCLVVAIPDAFEASQVIAQARAAAPGLAIVARAHADAEIDHLNGHGADTVIMGEHEIARGMIDWIGARLPAAATD